MPTSISTIELFREIFSHNGFPDVMVSGNATIFINEVFQNLCKASEIFQTFITLGHLAINGLAECNIQTVNIDL